MIKIDQLKLHVSAEDNQIKNNIAKKLRIQTSEIKDYKVLKRSIDARKKPELFFVYSVSVSLDKALEQKVLKKALKDNNINVYNPKNYIIPSIQGINTNDSRPIVIGAGPAGLFASYIFALNNMAPVVFERGKKVDDRTSDILKFCRHLL